MPDRTPAELTAALDAAFALGPVSRFEVRPIARGAVGQVWMLTVGTGRYAVKEYFWDVDPANVRREVALQAAAARHGVRSPRPIRARDGSFMAHMPEGLGGAVLRVYEWVDGVPVRAGDPDSPERLGALLAGLHRTRLRTMDEPDPWFEAVDASAEVWTTLADEAAAAGMPWAVDLRAAVPVLDMLLARCAPTSAAERIVCHLDVQPANLLADDAGWILLDWDDAGAGRADRELAAALLRWFAAAGSIDAEAISRTVLGYRSADGPATLSAPDAGAQHAAVAANFVLAQARLALDEGADRAHRADAGERLSTMLRNVMTVGDPRRVLELAGLQVEHPAAAS